MAERNGIVNDFNRNTNEIGFLIDREATEFQDKGMQLIVVKPPRCMHSLFAKTTQYNEGGRHEQRRQSRRRGPVLMRGSMRQIMGNAGRLVFDELGIVVGGAGAGAGLTPIISSHDKGDETIEEGRTDRAGKRGRGLRSEGECVLLACVGKHLLQV